MEGWQQKPAPVKLGAPLTAEERQAAQVAEPDPEQVADPMTGWVFAHIPDTQETI